jgi:hypothetical protein
MFADKSVPMYFDKCQCLHSVGLFGHPQPHYHGGNYEILLKMIFGSRGSTQTLAI